jgi:uncharacterized protein YhfF
MDVPDHVKSFWRKFLARTGRPAETPLYDAFHFTDSEAVADELAELVLRGVKAATASLLWEYEAEEGRIPAAGDLSVVTSWSGEPLCVIETTDVQTCPFEEVDEAFAAAEGEGDGTLAYWRQAHWSCFMRTCARLARQPSLRMPVVCERFEVVYAPARDDEHGR